MDGSITWILGWGVYSNARNIAKIKKNLHILQEQNQLQDKQIKQLAKFINLTMHQVNQHSEMLYKLDTKMTIMNKTIQQIMWSIDILHYETSLMHFFQNKLYRVYSSLYAIQSDTNSLFKYMRALASQELNPMIIPPDNLKNLLHKIEAVILQNNKTNSNSVRRLFDVDTNCSSCRPVIANEPLQNL